MTGFFLCCAFAEHACTFSAATHCQPTSGPCVHSFQHLCIFQASSVRTCVSTIFSSTMSSLNARQLGFMHVGTSQPVCHHTLHAILTHVGVRPGVAQKHCPGYNWLPQCTWSLRHAHRRPCKSDRPHQGGVHVSLPARDRTLPPDAVSQVHMHFCVHETLTMWTVSINCMPGMGSWLQPVMPSCAQGWIEMAHRVAQQSCAVFPSSTLW